MDVRLVSMNYAAETPGRNWSHTICDVNIEISVTRPMGFTERLDDSKRDDMIGAAWSDGDKIAQALGERRSTFGGLLDNLLQYVSSRYEVRKIEAGGSIVQTIHTFKGKVLNSQNQFSQAGEAIALLLTGGSSHYSGNDGEFLDDTSTTAIGGWIMMRPLSFPFITTDATNFLNGNQSGGRGFAFQTVSDGAVFRCTFADSTGANIVPAHFNWGAGDANKDHLFGFAFDGSTISLYHQGTIVGSPATCTGHRPATGSTLVSIAGFSSQGTTGVYIYGVSLANGTAINQATYYTACRGQEQIANVPGITALFSMEDNEEAGATWTDAVGGITVERVGVAVSAVVATLDWDT